MNSINNNLMALDVANTLKSHYGRLSTSVERLSSGLRVNSSADDAAGLAIRELMRADIAALNQGVRNVNDAISMLQVADGALGVMDEKLIRMKELAEQAATGTYDSTQRLMIDSEFQAMASEIERIARATDFNGIKLLDSDGQAALPAGVELNKPVSEIEQDSITTGTRKQYAFDPDIPSRHDYATGDIYTVTEITTKTQLSEFYIDNGKLYNKATTITETVTSEEHKEFEFAGITLILDNANPERGEGMVAYRIQNDEMMDYILETQHNGRWRLPHPNQNAYTLLDFNYSYENTPEDIDWWGMGKHHKYTFNLDFTGDGNTDFIFETYYENYVDPNILLNENRTFTRVAISIDENTESRVIDLVRDESITIKEVPMQKDGKVKIHFGPMNDSAEDYYYIEKRDCTLKGLGLDGVRVETQDNAQNALVTINDALVRKDQARAYYGAMQNRLENTVTNLTIQGENLQTAESRISDVDVATEMTQFVRNQVLTQSAVAMLGQANSYPHMLAGLIQG